MTSDGGLHPKSPAEVARAKGIAFVALSTVTWGSGGLFVRLLPYDPSTIIFWRGVFGTVFVGAFLLWHSGRLHANPFRHLDRNGVFIAICSGAGITLFPAAAQQTSVSNVYIILGTLPFFAAAIAWLWIGERPSAITVLASAFALIGIIIMLRPTGGGPQTGDYLAMLATAAQGLMTVAIRRKPDVDVLPLAWLSIVLSVLVAFPMAENLSALTVRDYIVAAGFGLVPMTFGMTLYMMGSALIPAALSALIGTLEAPIGAFWAWVGVGEVPAATTFIGGSIVLASVAGRLLMEHWTMGNGKSTVRE